jgi:hypothetical protein
VRLRRGREHQGKALYWFSSSAPLMPAGYVWRLKTIRQERPVSKKSGAESQGHGKSRMNPLCRAKSEEFDYRKIGVGKRFNLGASRHQFYISLFVFSISIQ